MKKLLGCVLLVAFLSAGCFKKSSCSYSYSNIVAPAAEQDSLEAYLDSNGISASKQSSGLYYKILSAGSGNSPSLCSQVTITYTGKLKNGDQFDNNTNAVFTLGALIEGWKIGLPMIREGGHIMLYVPPTLGYGTDDYHSGNVTIPGNSILIFDITLNGVQ